MTTNTPRRLLTALAVAAVGAAAAPAAASAAAIATNRCSTFVPGASGPQVAVAGAGFTAGGFVNFTYGGGTAGTLQADAAGEFQGRVNDPASIASGKHVRPYTLTAVDAANPFLRGTSHFKIVRFDASVPAKHPKPRERITFRLYGFPRHQAVWAHYVLHGKNRRNYSFGKVKGACGLLRKRVRTLPTRVHFGVWHIYLTNHKKFPRSHRARVRQSLSSFTYRHIVVSARAAAASVSGGDRFSG
jgi:hypothetical protein